MFSLALMRAAEGGSMPTLIGFGVFGAIAIGMLIWFIVSKPKGGDQDTM